jgi:dihydroorotase
MSEIIISNGHLIDPRNAIEENADIQIIDGRISAIEAAGSISAHEHAVLIDASGLDIIPGLIDCCARLREPGLEHKATIQSETIAAASAGITTLCCPPDTDPVIDEPAVVELINQKSADSGHSKVLTLGAMTAGLHGEHLSEMFALKQAGCVGLSNCRNPVENTQILKRAFAYAATFDMRVFIEPDEHSLSLGGCAHEGKIATRLGLKGIPVSAETIAIARALELVAETGVSAHFGRLSSAQGAEMVARAKNENRFAVLLCEVQYEFVGRIYLEPACAPPKFRTRCGVPPTNKIDPKPVLQLRQKSVRPNRQGLLCCGC